MTSNRCDNTCPCRTPICEETCREYQFETRFLQWLSVKYPAMCIDKRTELVEGASEIFDDLCTDIPFQREKVLEDLDKKCKVAADNWVDNDSHRDPFNDVRSWIAELRQVKE